MRKLFPLILILLSLLVAACGSSGTPQATLAPTQPPSCTVAGLLPPLDANLPPVGAGDWVTGAENPTVTMIEYTDYQCAYCAAAAPVLKQLLELYPDTLRLVIRHLPLEGHPLALLGAQGAEAAGLQGKFFEYHEWLYSKQDEWTADDEAAFETYLYEQVPALGIDLAKFKADLKSDAIVKKVKDSQSAAATLNLPGTPSFYFNGHLITGINRDLATLTEVVNLVPRMEAFETTQFKACPEFTVDPAKKYSAVVKTDKGDFTIQLYADKAPFTVNSFIFLAKAGWFNGITFHRVVANFVAQTGDPTGEGWGGPGYIFDNETNNLTYDRAGLVGMANRGPNTNGSQWFVTYSPQPDLNGGYTIFGEVTQGMDVVKSLNEHDPNATGEQLEADKIISIEIKENE